MSVFVDTSALYALLDPDDQDHRAAADDFEGLLAGERLVTHDYVVVEAATLVQRRLTPRATRGLLEDFVPLIDVVWIDRQIYESAASAFLAALGRRPSIVDWVSFEVMRRNGIRTAFCFDQDFARQGFDTRP